MSRGTESDPLTDDAERLFRSSVLPLDALKPKRDAGFYVLLALSIVYAVCLLSIVWGLTAHAHSITALNIYLLDPFATNETVGALVIVITVALIGAYNANIRRTAIGLLFVAHSIVAATAIVLVAISPEYPNPPDSVSILSTNAIIDGVVIVVLVILFLRQPRSAPEAWSNRNEEQKSTASSWMHILLLIYGTGFAIVAVSVVVARLLFPPSAALALMLTGPDPVMVNIVAKSSVLAAVSFYISGNPSQRKPFTPVLTLALGVGAIASLMTTLGGDTTIVTRENITVRIPWVMGAALIVNGLALALFLGVRSLQYRVDLQITSLRPRSADCVMALHEAFRESSQNPKVSSREVLHRIDEFIVGIRGKKRGIIGFPFWLMEHVIPIVSAMRPPFSTMSRDEQRWMLRRYVLRPSYEREKALLPALAEGAYAIGDITHSLLTFAYFSSSAGQAEAGYILPNARDRLQADIAVRRPPEMSRAGEFPKDIHDPEGRKPLIQARQYTLLKPRVSIPTPHDQLPDEVDYCVIGSGAAGGVLAYRLAEAKADHCSICVLERGGYYSPLQNFSDDEMEMVRTLYSDGGLQSARNFDFTILQGECVGGSTVVNNALCFEIPDVSKHEWENLGIDMSSLADHYQRVADEIHIEEVVPEAVNARVERLFTQGVDEFNRLETSVAKLSPAKRMRGNFLECVGCGLCNLGCRRVRKLSVLETYIPWARARGVKVVPEVTAIQCLTNDGSDRKTVHSLLVQTSNGELKKLGIRKGVILAAGAIASSRLLMRSGLGGNFAGRGISCNYAFPMLLEFHDVIDAFDGLQMTLFAAPAEHAMVFETTFNPPGTQSLMTPQYFGDHERMMNAYRRSMVIVALVGSDPSGTVSRDRSVLFGREVEWEQTPDEIRRVKDALSTGVRIARAAGAERVLLPTHPVLEIVLDGSEEKVLDLFARTVNDKRFFRFATPHPQGGNMMAGPAVEERVVDLDFRVRDCANLFLCDASIFPRSIRINPQWTIMALASQAGDTIARLT